MKTISLFILLFFCFLCGQGWYWLRDGFRLDRCGKLVQAVNSQKASLHPALLQTYWYLGKGRQMFAFVSEDGKYVLKIPRTSRYEMPFWMKVLKQPAFYAKKLNNKKNCKVAFLQSLDLAMQDLKEEAGILAVQVGFSSELHGQTLRLIDCLGRVFLVPMDKISFVLQKKQKLFIQELSRAIEEKEEVVVEKMLGALAISLKKRASQGILSKDSSFIHNFGYDGSSVLEMDVGSFCKIGNVGNREAFARSIAYASIPILQWLESIDPKLKQTFEEKLH